MINVKANDLRKLTHITQLFLHFQILNNLQELQDIYVYIHTYTNIQR